MRLRDKAKQKYEKYRDWIRFNRDLLIGELFAFPVAAGAAELTSKLTESPGWITFGSGAGDYFGYGVGYAGSSFFFNRDRYWDPETKHIKKEYYTDMAKYLLSANIGVGLYYVARSGLNYALLRHGMEPYQASIASQAAATVVWYGSMNLLGSRFGIVHKGGKNNDKNKSI